MFWNLLGTTYMQIIQRFCSNLKYKIKKKSVGSCLTVWNNENGKHTKNHFVFDKQSASRREINIKPTASSCWIQPVVCELFSSTRPTGHSPTIVWSIFPFVESNNWLGKQWNHPVDFKKELWLTPHCRWRGSASVLNDTDVRGLGCSSPWFIWASMQSWWTWTSAFDMAVTTAFSTLGSLKQEAADSGGVRTRWIRFPWTPRLSKVSTVVKTSMLFP